jgi:hypothetical protein
MIVKNVTITVKDDKASLSDKIILYQNDKGIDIYFTLNGFNYKVRENGLVGALVDARLMKPSGIVSVISSMSIVETNKIKFTIDSSMTDELSEVGTHTLQIRLYYDSTKKHRVTLPPITFEVKEEL